MGNPLMGNPLTTSQQQQLFQQQLQQLSALQYTAGLTNTITTASTFGGAGGAVGTSTFTYPTYTQATYSMPPIEKLVMCEPGWRYVRWRKDDTDEAVSVEVVPIMALAVTGREVNYILGDVKARMMAGAFLYFLAVLAPNVEYDAAHWTAKAQAAYYDYHANEVAQRLLKSAAGV